MSQRVRDEMTPEQAAEVTARTQAGLANLRAMTPEQAAAMFAQTQANIDSLNNVRGCS